MKIIITLHQKQKKEKKKELFLFKIYMFLSNMTFQFFFHLRGRRPVFMVNVVLFGQEIFKGNNSIMYGL